MGQAIIENLSQQFVKWLDVQHLTIAAGDTLQYAFQNTVDLPVGSYYVMMYRSSDSIDINASNTLGAMQFPAQFRTDIDFWMVDSNRSELTNLVIFIRFADDEEITLLAAVAQRLNSITFWASYKVLFALSNL